MITFIEYRSGAFENVMFYICLENGFLCGILESWSYWHTAAGWQLINVVVTGSKPGHTFLEGHDGNRKQWTSWKTALWVMGSGMIMSIEIFTRRNWTKGMVVYLRPSYWDSLWSGSRLPPRIKWVHRDGWTNKKNFYYIYLVCMYVCLCV